MATKSRRRASLCLVPPGRGFSPELSASSIPSNVAARRCSPRSVVCQQSSRTRSRPRHAASAPAAATSAAVAFVLLLLCNFNLLIPSAAFLGAPPSLNCYCADTPITVHAADGFSSSLPLLSFVTFFAVSTQLHDSSDSSYKHFNLMPCLPPSSSGVPDSVRLGFASFLHFPT